MRKITDLLIQRYQRYPQNEEIAATCAMNRELVDSTQIIAQNYFSLDTPIARDTDLRMLDLIENNKSELPDTDLVIKSFRKRVIDSLDFLNKREKEIIILCFGLDGGKAYTLGEIGKRYNLTRERVRQLRNKALMQLKNRDFKELYKEYFYN